MSTNQNGTNFRIALNRLINRNPAETIRWVIGLFWGKQATSISIRGDWQTACDYVALLYSFGFNVGGVSWNKSSLRVKREIRGISDLFEFLSAYSKSGAISQEDIMLYSAQTSAKRGAAGRRLFDGEILSKDELPRSLYKLKREDKSTYFTLWYPESGTLCLPCSFLSSRLDSDGEPCFATSFSHVDNVRVFTPEKNDGYSVVVETF